MRQSTIIITFLLLSFAYLAQAQRLDGQMIGDIQNPKSGAETNISWIIEPNSLALELQLEYEGSTQTTRMTAYPNADKLDIISTTVDGENWLHTTSSQELAKLNPDTISVGSLSLTGNTKQIGEYNCKEAKADAGAYKTTIWFTEDISVDMSTYAPFFLNSIAIKALGKEGIIGFPLISETYDNRGNLIEKVEVK